MIIAGYVLFFLYTVLIISLAIGVLKVKNNNDTVKQHQNSFSVIIPFRNEAKNLPDLLNSISNLDYTKKLVEFIFVDDASTDTSLKIVEAAIFNNLHTNITVLKNNRTTNSPKKDAITTAITEAKNQWIITTDADCILPKKWLSSFDALIQKKNPNMVVAPVNYSAKNSFLEQFQLLDFLSMQATTMGGFGLDFPFLCNGANLAYKKNTFLKLKGFKGNEDIASGDDIFLFEKFIKDNKKKVLYLKSKSAIVTTFPVKSWLKLLHQRTRWAAKTSNFNSFKVKTIGLLVFAANLFILLCLATKFFNLSISLLAIKIGVDFCLFLTASRFFNVKNSFFKWYVIASIVYTFFSTLVVFNSLFFKYSWKGRVFKK